MIDLGNNKPHESNSEIPALDSDEDSSIKSRTRGLWSSYESHVGISHNLVFRLPCPESTRKVLGSDTMSSSAPSMDGTKNAQAPVEKLDRALGYLRETDDSSKFRGLGQLRSILDNKRELREDPQVIFRCWAAIPTSILDRLLRGADYKGEQVVDRDYMIGLAVAIIHTFATLIPEAFRDDEKFAGRADGLLAASKIM